MGRTDIYALADALIETSHKAGRAIMNVYSRDFSVEFKSDASPVTEADQLAEDIILADLVRVAPDIPVIAEEAASAGHIPEIGERFFLVDPLDGTKEFIKKNDEFTVNIALIERGKSIFGIVYAPALSMLYVTLGPDRAVSMKLNSEDQYISLDGQVLQRLRTTPPDNRGLNVIASRSHVNEETTAYLSDLQVASIISAGSSLKFCRLAEGVADIYPRFAPTMEWDTAAGHAVLLAAGGAVLTLDEMPLCYGKSDAGYLNSHFIAYGQYENLSDVRTDGDADINKLVARAELEISDQQGSADTANEEKHSDQFAVYLIWKGGDPLLPGRSYSFIHPNAETACSISSLRYRLEPESGEHLAAETLSLHEIGYCNIELDQSIDYESACQGNLLGRFVLKDNLTDEEVAIGLIQFSLCRATNIRWQALEIDQTARAQAKHQTPHVLWFTGLSGSGKSTIASLLEKKLHSMGHHTYVLDGDNVRHGLCRDLGFTDVDRVENIRRISEIARLFVDAGLIVLVSFISPFSSERRMARELFMGGEFKEIFVDTSLEICEQRDPKGLYKKARQGEIKNFTGLDSPYESPEHAEIVLTGGISSPEILVDQILQYLKQEELL